jgi:NADH dehydrogenase
MKIERVCILGGTGFVGHHLVTAMANSGRQVRVLSRRRERHRENLVHPTVEIVTARVRDIEALTSRFEDIDCVVYLPGILNQSKQAQFRDVHVDFPREVSEACIKAGVKRILHMSALNADTANGASEYLRTKGEGEDIMHLAAGAGIQVTSFRPSVIFGHDDSFFNRFADLLRISPVMPLACPDARFAPVYVGDVSEAFVNALENAASFGKRLELCGPDIYTLKQLVEYTARMLGTKRLVLPLSQGLSEAMAKVMQYAPGTPLTPDNVKSMQLDSVCTENGFAVFDMTPQSVQCIMPAALQNRTSRGQYGRYRKSANRD